MDSYFGLDKETQGALLESALNQGHGPNAAVLEKDIWLCLVLQELFSMPNALPMVFKGGTSLSKVYTAISRFSEDVDVTLDWRKLVTPPVDLGALSNNAIRNLSEQIQAALEKYLEDTLRPALEEQLKRHADVSVEFARDDEGKEIKKDALVVHYPSAADYGNGYIRPSVLIEFGGRNDIEPEEERIIAPEVATLFPGIRFPEARVTVLSPIRTFWEKATLAHDEAHRPVQKKRSSERQSRHWYDLFRLADHNIGREALASRTILEQVVATKTRFFKYAFSRYDLCLKGEFRIIPDQSALSELQADYVTMTNASMFYGDPVDWASVESRLRALEKEINTAIFPSQPAIEAT
ncbi:nucleotidyl transferase AbiEii/AbiGii toxin family protein [uncultured Stenotrophomonas sp.]|uniref:nucleotidyl transferase AbiEii/AbiGii toxin family protein n=1 Tax=uncultured Stenotrophomonas sp. TaxID=165438 RepID=UPI0025EB91D5|nr:nucleotidyl transferase AbiEii/AbiGii toxin family protein [uncultured Stenotrophomonas sp.]